MKTAKEMAEGFPRGGHQVRALNLYHATRKETMLLAADELEKLLASTLDSNGSMKSEDDYRAITEAWIRATRETAEKE